MPQSGATRALHRARGLRVKRSRRWARASSRAAVHVKSDRSRPRSTGQRELDRLPIVREQRALERLVLGMTQPWVGLDQRARRGARLREQRLVATEIGEAEARQAALSRAPQLAGTAQRE